MKEITLSPAQIAAPYDQLHAQGIRVRVFADKTSKGPFCAVVSCAVTDRPLVSIEGVKTLERAIFLGKEHVKKFIY